MTNLLDSSVWVALFLDFDTQHAKASVLFGKLRGKIHLPYCVLNEVVTILAYKHSKAQANRFIEFVEGNRDIAFMEDNAQDELAFYKSLHAKISLTDAAIMLFSKRLKMKLITFDRQLERLSVKI